MLPILQNTAGTRDPVCGMTVDSRKLRARSLTMFPSAIAAPKTEACYADSLPPLGYTPSTDVYDAPSLFAVALL